MRTEDASQFIGQYCSIDFPEPDGSPGRMVGWVMEIVTENDGDWITTDFGNTARVAAVTRITPLDPPRSETWEQIKAWWDEISAVEDAGVTDGHD